TPKFRKRGLLSMGYIPYKIITGCKNFWVRKNNPEHKLYFDPNKSKLSHLTELIYTQYTKYPKEKEFKSEKNNKNFFKGPEPIIPSEATNVEVFHCTSDTAYVGYTLPNGNFEFVQIPIKLKEKTPAPVIPMFPTPAA